MAIRVGHAAVRFEDLGQLTVRWLFRIRQAVTPSEPRGSSEFAHDLSSIAQEICWKHAPEIEVGPYAIDFAGLAAQDGGPPLLWDDEKPGRSLARCCVALEADGPSHFYRPHPPISAPSTEWHWTSGSKLRHRLLTGMGIRVAHVPYFEWARLETDHEKEAY